MIVVIATNKIKPAQRGAALDVMHTYLAGCRDLPGVTSVTFTEVVGDPNTFIGIEEYEDQAAFEFHGRSEVFHTMMGALGTLLADSPVVNAYTISEKKQLM